MTTTRIGRVFAVLLVLSGLLHGYGSLGTYPPASAELAWSLGSAAFAIFLGVLGFQVLEPGMSRLLVHTVISGLVFWMIIVLLFGVSIGNPADPRVVVHLVASIGLAATLVPRWLR